jgi:hypothetical protein
MDTSEQYIKMCKKAVEIQKLWKPATGDFYGWVICESTGHEIWQDGNKINVVADIWLPRQDQLQKILALNTTNKTLMLVDGQIREFYNFAMDWNFTKTNSMETLWLEFVMKELYNKTWNGKDWISVEQQNPPNTIVSISVYY